MRWTPEMDDHLLSMRRDGHTFEAIGATLGVTRSSTHGRFLRLTDPRYAMAGRPDTYVRRAEFRYYRDIQPAANPYQTDSSCPAFSDDEAHCSAVNRLGGFSAFVFRSAA